jgi:hypothetical protein
MKKTIYPLLPLAVALSLTPTAQARPLHGSAPLVAPHNVLATFVRVIAPADNSTVATNLPTYSGTGVAGNPITVYVDGTSIGTTTSDGNGNWSLSQPTALSPGSHTISATIAVNSNTYPSNTNTFTVTATSSAPTLTSLSSTSGLAGSSVTLTGTNFTGATAVAFNGTATSSFTVVNATTITATVPTGAGTGPVTVTTPGGTATGPSFTQTFPDLVISTPGQTIAAGTYNSITINNGGVATATGIVEVNSSVIVNDGGALYLGLGTSCYSLRGSANFTLAAGGTLGICAPVGINTSTNSNVNVTGTRSFSDDANYVYIFNGPGTSSFTGNALPTTVRSLEVNTRAATTIRLSGPVQVRQRLLLTNGSLFPASQTLTLLSNANGTALVVNSGTYFVNGPATMQRYIGTNRTTDGYRHYASPVQAETVNTLATTGYTPDFSGAAAYNSSANPNLVTPFPTVFRYNQDRIATTTSPYNDFGKGWQAALSGEAMTPGVGFSVQAPGTVLVDFTGVPTTGAITRSGLQRTGTEGGWHLLGNPYPAPLDWSTMTMGTGQSLEGMDGAVYVFQSSGPYAGTYRVFQNNIGDPIIPAGSGFFVRTTTPSTAGTVRFANTNRVTTFGPQPAFGRSTTQRSQVALTLTNAAATLADELTIYAEAGATTGADAQYDAAKLANPSGLNLAAVAATGEEQAIAGLPALTSTTVLPLRLSVPAAGTYTLALHATNLPAGLVAYLRDLSTGTQQALTSASLTLPAGLSTRYALAFAPAGGALAAASALTAAQVALFPNPTTAKAGVTVALPVAAGTAAVQAEVLNALGQTVATTTLTVRGGEARGGIATAGLAAGVYTVRLTTGTTTLSKRLVVE